MATLKVLEAKNLKSMDLNGLNDPYCLIASLDFSSEFIDKNSCVRSETKRWTLNPVWNKAVFKLDPKNTTARIEVWDKDDDKEDDFLGFVILTIDPSLPFDKWIPLQYPNTKKSDYGEIHVVVQNSENNKNSPKSQDIIKKFQVRIKEEGERVKKEVDERKQKEMEEVEVRERQAADRRKVEERGKQEERLTREVEQERGNETVKREEEEKIARAVEEVRESERVKTELEQKKREEEISAIKTAEEERKRLEEEEEEISAIRTAEEERKRLEEEEEEEEQRKAGDGPFKYTMPTQVKLEATATILDNQDVLVHISASAGSGSRTPLDLLFLMDTSASMRAQARKKTEKGWEPTKLTLLDVAKHSVKALINSLSPEDRVSVMSFSYSTVTHFKLTCVSTENKVEMFQKVDAMAYGTDTYLTWGLRKALQELRSSTTSERLPAILVFTDGMIDSDPTEFLAGEKKKGAANVPLIYTYGFGYGIDTPVLLKTAELGNGLHTFVSSAKYLGQTFANGLANLMATMATHVTLSIRLQNGATVKEISGYEMRKTKIGYSVNVCSLQYGQTKDVVICLSVPENTNPDLPFIHVTLHGAKSEPLSLKFSEIKPNKDRNAEESTTLFVQQLRQTVVSTIGAMMVLCSRNEDAALSYQSIFSLAEKYQHHPLGTALFQDISGQIKEAIQREPEDFFEEWGLHYLPSLARAHLLQQCNSSRDPGIQTYGGVISNSVKKEVENNFREPPKASSTTQPSISLDDMKRIHFESKPHQGAEVSHGVTSNDYWCESNESVCFTGECLVWIIDSTFKRVDEVRKGDRVRISCEGDEVGEVECILKTICHQSKSRLVTLPGGLKITPYHPVRVGDWKFPRDMAPEIITTCPAVYSFVMKEIHQSIVVNGIECATLGHHLEGPVIGHPYFGTKRIIDDLKSNFKKGWKNGRITLVPKFGKVFVRNGETGLVDGLVDGLEKSG